MKILFVCTANSCRSQMAEGWARHLFPADWTAASAGLVTYPIHARTRAIMAEAGVDLTGQEPKTIDAVDLASFDLVVTLSEESGRFLPPLPVPSRHRRHPLADPMAARGDHEQIRQAYRAGRDAIRAIVAGLVAEFAG